MTSPASAQRCRPHRLIGLQVIELLLAALIDRLRLEHPALEDFARRDEPPALSEARAILDHVDLLRFALDAYDEATCRQPRGGGRADHAEEDPF